MKGEIFEKYIYKIDESKKLLSPSKLKGFVRLYNLILEALSDEERINFTSLFSRVTYVGAKLKINGPELFLLHAFRRGIENDKVTPENEKQYLDLGRYVCVRLVNQEWKTKIEQKVNTGEIYRFFTPVKENLLAFHYLLSGLIVSYDITQKTFGFIHEENGVDIWTIKYDVFHKNEIFTQNLEVLFGSRKLPVHINLIDVEHLEGDVFLPKAFIIEPDYMIDVTAVANTFKYYGTEPLEFILNKYKPPEMSIHLLIGNVANFLLDELINDINLGFTELIPKIFGMSPLTFSCLDDRGVMEVMKVIEMHYDHLKTVLKVEFKKEDIQPTNVYLEPSFYSQTYGIQGRLDLLHEHDHDKHYDIVELKSGSPFLPNNYGLSVQHYTQTLLYDLIIKSAYKGRKKTSNYILYSKENEWNLRNAPVMKVQQYEAMKVRNTLLLEEDRMCSLIEDGSENILTQINPTNFPKAKGFSKKDVELFHKTYRDLSNMEKSYLVHFSSFIAAEHRQAKIGVHGLSRSNGLAALWLENKNEKEERFSILYGLEILENHTDGDVPILKLGKSQLSPKLSKFRKGDIVVLYPDSGIKSVLNNQIFKCNIINIDDQVIELKLRSRQYNHRIFRENNYWAIEGDVMDSAFLSMYRSLFIFAKEEASKRSLILGLKAPSPYELKYEYHSPELTEEQNHLLNAMIQSKDYFLLWGPPGTGKTSVMIKHLIKYLFYYTDEKIMIAAYTNRAVDELCAAALSALPEEDFPFLRVGSSHSCGSEFVGYLLDERLKKYGQRKKIIKHLSKHRIIISTISSIMNRVELFHLYKFDSVIIDEASQILEPMLVGLLTKFKKWIMIGDHKQLPAVVVQDKASTQIKDESLTDCGIYDTSTSLFERLYLRCNQKGWTHAYGVLTAQGRMHEDLMAFANIHFYENKLSTINGIRRLSTPFPDLWKGMAPSILNQERLIYIPTELDDDFAWKTNKSEAELCVELVKIIKQNYSEAGKEWKSDTLGIITPYRAQIAYINNLMPDAIQDITIDTVERYQGGARDIIIISLCTNRLDQIEKLVSLSAEGIDRKLNVALTRSREQIVFMGNQELLSSNATYAALIASASLLKRELIS